MKIAYEVINRGTAQERLDNTFDALVRITGLRPQLVEGPGSNFWTTGHPPADGLVRWIRAPTTCGTRKSFSTWILWTTPFSRWIGPVVRFVSAGIVQLDNGRRAASVLDPDGHVIELEQ